MHKRIRLHVVNKDMLLWEGTSTFACIEICRGMGELQGECVFVCVCVCDLEGISQALLADLLAEEIRG